MSVKVERLNSENAEGSHIMMDGDDPVDVAGIHPARIFYLERKVSAKGTPYHTVGAEILSGPAQGATVFGPVFKGRSRTEFLRALGLDPVAARNELHGNQVIGKQVQITVEAEEREAADGNLETRHVIRSFAPLS